MLTNNYMDFNAIQQIKEAGFTGFKTVTALWEDKSCIPKIKGVYLVLDPSTSKKEFIVPGAGGFFKGKDPNIPVADLQSNLVPDSKVIYIGKAGSPTGKATLHSRLGQYLRFGQNKNVGHWGGRYIWQLKYHSELMFCWKPTPQDDPREVEKALLNLYVSQFGTRPFANLRG